MLLIKTKKYLIKNPFPIIQQITEKETKIQKKKDAWNTLMGK